jgi:S1-C subfamily serine protease
MKKYLIGCLFSALVGAILAVGFTDYSTRSGLTAQDRRSEDLPARIPDVLIDDTGATRTPHVLASADLTRFTPEERVNISVYETVNRSVVHITTRTLTREMFRRAESVPAGTGSGSVLDGSGHILTNWHVVEGASKVIVTLFNGESYEAGLIGRDPANDIAVLRIAAPRETLYPITLGDSSNLRVGQKALAIGNPFGLERTLTVGILSSLNRKLPSRTGRPRDDIKSVIQIDAALNPGNSGGPLLDGQSKMIGMNTAIASTTQANTGVGFAIPVNTIKRVVPELIERGRVLRPVIGISSVHETDRGLLVIEVTRSGPAGKAGLQGFKWITEREQTGPFITERTYLDRRNADLIVAIDGKQVRSGDELLDVVESKKPGDQVVLRIIRAGREVDLNVTLGVGE